MIQCVRDDEKAIGVACISSTTASNDTVMEKMQAKASGCAIVRPQNFHNPLKALSCGRKGGNI